MSRKERKVDDRDLAGYCGIFCGLCTKFQSLAKSRCPDCRLGEIGPGPYCSIWNCATKKKMVDSCAFCEDLTNCEIFERRKVMEWPTVGENLEKVKREGMESWIDGEKEKREVVEELLDTYNEGRSMAFFCRAVSRMPLESIEDGLRKMQTIIRSGEVEPSDMKKKAKAMRSMLSEIAQTEGISLK